MHNIYKVIQAQKKKKKKTCSPSYVDPNLQCIHYVCKQIYVWEHLEERRK